MFFVEREIFFAVDGEREDRAVVLQYSRRTVALVNVGVYDDDFFYGAFVL